MSKATFTPGPWFVGPPSRAITQVDTKTGTICRAIGWTPDAHLIAAAPDLYAALCDAAIKLRRYQDDVGITQTIGASEVAIAKAEGRQP